MRKTPTHLLDLLQPGAIVINRRSGRRMEVIKYHRPSGLLCLTVAQGDPERRQWDSWKTRVAWRPEWVWLPGQQISLSFGRVIEPLNPTGATMPKPSRRRCGYLKLIVDGRVVEIFPASKKTPRHDRLARLQGCFIQPAIEADYREFIKQSI